MCERPAENLERVQLGNFLLLYFYAFGLETSLCLGIKLLNLAEDSGVSLEDYILIGLEELGVCVVSAEVDGKEGSQTVQRLMHVVLLSEEEHNGVADEIVFEDEGSGQVLQKALKSEETGLYQRGVYRSLLEVGLKDEAAHLVDGLELRGEFLLQHLHLL